MSDKTPFAGGFHEPDAEAADIGFADNPNVSSYSKVFSSKDVVLSSTDKSLFYGQTDNRSSGDSCSSTDNRHFQSSDAVLRFARSHGYALGRKLTDNELFPWGHRLEIESERAKPVAIPAPELPTATHHITRRYFTSFIYLLQCRQRTDPSNEVPFTHEFAAAWCGITTRQAKDARRECVRLKVMVYAGRAKRDPRLKLWKLGAMT